MRVRARKLVEKSDGRKTRVDDPVVDDLVREIRDHRRPSDRSARDSGDVLYLHYIIVSYYIIIITIIIAIILCVCATYST